MNEEDFISSIDCCFPYDDGTKWMALVTAAIKISDNAAFMVLHEMCRLPHSKKVKNEDQIKMVRFWQSVYSHPISHLVVEAGESIINGERLPKEKVLNYMKQIAKYKGLYDALNIVYFSLQDKYVDDSAACKEVDGEYERIINDWRTTFKKTSTGL